MVGFVQNKVFALVLGPFGVGIFSQSQGLYSAFSPVVSLSATKGLTKYTAGESSAKTRVFLSTAITASLVIFIFLLPLVVLFSRYIAGAAFNDPRLSSLVIAVYFWVFFSSISAFYDSILQALGEIKLLSLRISLFSILALAVVLPFLYFFRVTGVIAALSVSSLGTIIFSQIVLYRRYKIIPSFGDFRLDNFGKLFRFGIANVLTGLISSYSTLIVGVIVVRNLSLSALGIYQVALILATIPTDIVQTAINRYLFPQLSAPRRQEHAVVYAQNDALRITLFFTTPALVLIIVLSKFLLLFMFSSAFVQAAAFLPLIVIGEFIKNVVWMVGASILPKARLKAAVIFDGIYAAVFIVLAHLLVVRFQLIGIATAFVISYLVFTVIVYVYQVKTGGFFIQSYNLDLLIKCTLLIVSAVAVFYLQSNVILAGAICFGLMVAWLVVSLNKKEILQLGNLGIEVSRSIFKK